MRIVIISGTWAAGPLVFPKSQQTGLHDPSRAQLGMYLRLLDPAGPGNRRGFSEEGLIASCIRTIRQPAPGVQ